MITRPYSVREPSAAGTFYPRDSLMLANAIDRLMRSAPGHTGLRPKALVVPHDGIRRSGRVAAAAYATLAPLRGSITRAVIVGPAHFQTIAGIAVPEADAFSTPLGALAIDDDLRLRARSCDSVIVDDLPHLDEYGIEVQLPFLQRVLGDVTILPAAVARVPGWSVGEFLDAVWGGPETLVVLSTDLSHGDGAAEARTRDQRTAEAIAGLHTAGLTPDDACGFYPLQGFLHVAEQRGLRGRCLDLRTSAEATGDESNVIGFGAFAFEPAE